MDAAQETLLTDRQRYWLEHIQACEASGKGVGRGDPKKTCKYNRYREGEKVLVKKGMLARTRPTRFQRARVVDTAVGSEWRIQLPNGISVVFAGPADASTLTTVLNTAAAVE